MDYHEFDNTVSHFCSFLTTVACMCDINDFHFYCRIIVGPTVLYIYKPVQATKFSSRHALILKWFRLTTSARHSEINPRA